jgi:hypothetical protein
MARSRYGGRELTAETPRERGDNPTVVLVGAGAAQLGRVTVDRGGDGSFSMGQSFGARRMGVGGGIGCGGEMGCSWSLYIGRDG